MITKENLIDIILKTNIGIEKDDIIIEIPKDRALGDFAMPCFGLAKKCIKIRVLLLVIY